MDSNEQKNTRSLNLLAYLAVQLVVAVLIMTITFLLWFSSQVTFYRMSLAIPIIVLPLESAVIGLAILTYQKQRCWQLGAWIIIGLFRVVIALQLPFIPWIYMGPWPPPPSSAMQISIIVPAELLIGIFTCLWLYFLRDEFVRS